jgi:hypothetical protein
MNKKTVCSTSSLLSMFKVVFAGARKAVVEDQSIIAELPQDAIVEDLPDDAISTEGLQHFGNEINDNRAHKQATGYEWAGYGV